MDGCKVFPTRTGYQGNSIPSHDKGSPGERRLKTKKREKTARNLVQIQNGTVGMTGEKYN